MANKTITLSKVERMQFILQLRLLQKMSHNDYEKKEYENQIIALQRGYAIHYQDIFEELSEEDMSDEECSEVLSILKMCRGIIYSYMALKRNNKNEHLTDSNIFFPGFDGNNESKQMFFVDYFINTLDRYFEVQEYSGHVFNSHRQMLQQYRRKLVV